MIKNDFPLKWPQFINQIHTCLSTDKIDTWHSVLLVFYTLVQHFEYVPFLLARTIRRARSSQIQEGRRSHSHRRRDVRRSTTASSTLHATVHTRRIRPIGTNTEADPQDLSCLHAGSSFVHVIDRRLDSSSFQLHLNFRVLSNQTMATWLDTCCAMIERRLPDRLSALDDDDRPAHPWWKCKKWAMHILIRTFERSREIRHRWDERSTSYSRCLDTELRRTCRKIRLLKEFNSLIST